jgi:SSS family solute:Na+ symporter
VKPEGSNIYEIPFLDRMGFVFVFCIVGMVLISLIQGKGQPSPKGLEIDSSMFRPNRSFAIGSAIVLVIITGLYTIFW